LSAPRSTEPELKFLLPNEAALRAIAKAAGKKRPRFARQENHFFDTRQRSLRKAKFSLRLRHEGKKWLLTLKGRPARAKGARFFSEPPQVERAVTASEARAILRGAKSALEALAGTNSVERSLLALAHRACRGAALEHAGSFANERARLPVRLAGASLLLELDRTHFPGGRVDFELEVELPESLDAKEGQTAVLGLLAKANVSPAASTPKAQRFAEALIAWKPAGRDRSHLGLHKVSSRRGGR
jgi:uncharacterized protein YjbK